MFFHHEQDLVVTFSLSLFYVCIYLKEWLEILVMLLTQIGLYIDVAIIEVKDIAQRASSVAICEDKKMFRNKVAAELTIKINNKLTWSLPMQTSCHSLPWWSSWGSPSHW